MKGITHFFSGIAVASCFPYAIESAIAGKPMCFIVAGFMSLIPDTIDFKLLCFLKHVDYRIAPEHKEFNPQQIADDLARAINNSHAMNKSQIVRLCSIRTSPDNWFEYSVTFKGCEIIVHEGNDEKKSDKVGTAKTGVPFHCSYNSTVTASIFTGPTITIIPKEGHTLIDFLDWHRSFTHSFTFGLVLSLIISIFNIQVGIIGFCAYSSHILIDQLGHMGSSILWPFKKQKIVGGALCYSTSTFANMFITLTAILITFANIFYYQNPTQLLVATRIVIIPIIIMLIYKKLASTT
ncbi:MAG: metal-dependent hydrolase [Kiritimatiellae bacterium]|jgi:membrane-bound metal-dependent hydrolase YbcI (DUF457 family)|nr:metal-dependent hydrolase [Kiritimatiellia bacterium]